MLKTPVRKLKRREREREITQEAKKSSKTFEQISNMSKIESLYREVKG